MSSESFARNAVYFQSALGTLIKQRLGNEILLAMHARLFNDVDCTATILSLVAKFCAHYNYVNKLEVRIHK